MIDCKGTLIEKCDIATYSLCCVLNPHWICDVCDHRECLLHVGQKNNVWYTYAKKYYCYSCYQNLL
jgi:hypothetical protein